MSSFCHTSCIISSYESNVWLILHSAGLDVDSCLCLQSSQCSITRNQVISLVTASTEFIELSSQTLQSSLVSLQRFNLLWLWDCEAGCNISLFWNITWLTIRWNIWPKIRKKERITEGPSRSDHFQSTVISLECTFHLVFFEFYTDINSKYSPLLLPLPKIGVRIYVFLSAFRTFRTIYCSTICGLYCPAWISCMQ